MRPAYKQSAEPKYDRRKGREGSVVSLASFHQSFIHSMRWSWAQLAPCKERHSINCHFARVLVAPEWSCHEGIQWNAKGCARSSVDLMHSNPLLENARGKQRRLHTAKLDARHKINFHQSGSHLQAKVHPHIKACNAKFEEALVLAKKQHEATEAAKAAKQKDTASKAGKVSAHMNMFSKESRKCARLREVACKAGKVTTCTHA
eukprot:1155224-Pelagomonas_calceolata.AAC.13